MMGIKLLTKNIMLYEQEIKISHIQVPLKSIISVVGKVQIQQFDSDMMMMQAVCHVLILTLI